FPHPDELAVDDDPSPRYLDPVDDQPPGLDHIVIAADRQRQADGDEVGAGLQHADGVEAGAREDRARLPAAGSEVHGRSPLPYFETTMPRPPPMAVGASSCADPARSALRRPPRRR